MRAPGHSTSCGTDLVARPVACVLAGLALIVSLAACDSGSPSESDIAGTTSGPAYAEPAVVATAPFDASRAMVSNGFAIDASHSAEGYLGVSGTSAQRLKLQVSSGEMSYNYDVPSDGMPVIVPLNMGDGAYDVRVLESVGGSQYATVASTTVNVVLESEFAPFLRPNVFCDYDEGSACVQKARELAAGADNEGDVVRAIYRWMVDTIEYDDEKAERLSGVGGYVPDPDDTLASESGICFDYASLAAAMFRSLGIPCQIVTGNVAPENVYHAWNMIYIDGAWQSVLISVDPDDWTRIDLTFAASNDGVDGADGQMVYTERYRY